MGRKILVIDDDPSFTMMVKTRLESHHYAVIVAADGESGLEVTQKEKPDLIILDIQMPNMDGYTFVQEIKRIDDVKNTPIIIITAKDHLEDLFKQEGIFDYLVKPFDIKVLLDKIKNYIGYPK